MRGQKSKERRMRLQEESRIESVTIEPVVEQAAVNAILDYAQLVQLVMPLVKKYDGTSEGKIRFLDALDRLNLTTRQFVDATWILSDNMRDTARQTEKARQIGKTADELWGEFDVNWALAMIAKGGE